MPDTPHTQTDLPPPLPLPYRQRRILGVLMEKARTTPDVYPLSLNGLVTGCNQKSNRHPLMDLTAEQVEDELEKMRAAGIVAEVQGGSRVPKYRHFGYDYMHVKGAEAAVMTELLLRGEQTVGELRTRASRFEPIADLSALQQILDSLIERGLVIPLTPAGRGQLVTHNLYLPEELTRLKQLAGHAAALSTKMSYGASEMASDQSLLRDHPTADMTQGQSNATTGESSVKPVPSPSPAPWVDAIESLREEVFELRRVVDKLTDRLDRLES